MDENEMLKINSLAFVALLCLGFQRPIVFCHHVIPSCNITAQHCDFEFSIEHNYTMMK